MSSATYKYSLKADRGYTSEQSGKISPERHGVVCAVFDGGLSDDLLLLRAAPDLLESLRNAEALLRAIGEQGGSKTAIEKADEMALVIAKAASNSN